MDQAKKTKQAAPKDELWAGTIDGREYRVRLDGGAIVTESRGTRYDDWRRFTESGYGSNIREQVLEQALLKSISKKRKSS